MLYNDFPYSFAFIKSSGLQPGKENLLVPSALSVDIIHHDNKFYANMPLSTHLWKYHIIFVPEKGNYRDLPQVNFSNNSNIILTQNISKSYLVNSIHYF